MVAIGIMIKDALIIKIGEEDGYQFLRVPFTAVNGELDVPGVIVRLENAVYSFARISKRTR